MGAKNLSNSDRTAVLQHLLTLVNGKSILPHGAFAAVAANFGVARSTVRLIWKRAAVNLNDKLRPCSDVSSRIKGHCGRNLKHESVASRLQALPKAKRTTFRSIAAALNMPRSTLHAYYKRGIFVKYSSSVRPALTDSNKIVRVKWALDFVHALNENEYVFSDMMDYVHVDEKWFFATTVKRTYYLAPGEEPPHRTCKSKKFITKVMFLSAVARPRWDSAKGELFDGKLGTWHFTTKVPAIRGSRNRPAGTLVTSPVSVTRSVYKAMLLDHVIPAIKRKWPSTESKKITIQQDNARPHIPPRDHDIVAACTSDGWAMEVKYQPPNSPDMNILDLGFFRAIQSLQVKNHSRCIDDIVSATEQAWIDVESATLNANFLTLQCCLQEVVRMGGNNNYKIPHMKKAALAARGMLPQVVPVESDVIESGLNLLAVTDVDSKIEELAEETALAIELSEFCTQLEGLDVQDDADDDAIDILQILGLNIV